ncbi:UMP kinase [Segnochrobactrum spirostomi]|uniref:Uridylate kinase n=1 Tax=Segnochrobactrum spirostomi TaxID=2608987 RepID=A0A6A7Y0Z7_9HYPH|nr:UMP kinase [Segnochrobactrum spirostomi]MQT12057.1 UMP kinase [Segnochrobactrum spirostomi]
MPPVPDASSAKLSWKRVLLKLSGEALMGDKGFGIDNKVIDRLAGEIDQAVKLGAEVGVVVGGGNFVRGARLAAGGTNRVAGDHMGMLATVMNCLALHDALARRGLPARVLSAVAVPAICETFTQRAALEYMAQGHVVLFAGGTGNPFFTTDSGAALRAAEMGCDALLKGTNVDGIYSADPRLEPDAVRYDRITHQEVLARGLAVMDAAAIALARDNAIPVIVFSIQEEGEFIEVLQGGGRATVVAD